MGEEMGTGREKTILLIEYNPQLNQMIEETVQNNFESKVKIISFYYSTLAVDYSRENEDKVCLIIRCRLLHAGNGFRLLHECKTLKPDLLVILHTALVWKDKFSPFDECIDKQTGFLPLITAISELLKI